MKTKIFGFCKIESYGSMAKGSLLLPNDKTRRESIKHRIGVYASVNDGINFDDFYRTEEIPINSDTDSLQVRTKIVYKNSKGYYIKEKGKPFYLDEITIKSMEAIFDFEVIL